MTSRYNLWDEPWLLVEDDEDRTQRVSLTELFENAHHYQSFAGEMVTQDFAVMRVVLAILETTFTRYRMDGTEQELKRKSLHTTWKDIWQNGRFPMVPIREYRDEWKDRFNLYDDEHPFYQITQPELEPIRKQMRYQNSGHVKTKLIDRNYSESNNKRSLAIPGKDILTDDALVRWLIAYQSYTSVGDKGKLPTMDKGQKISRGWLFNLGGVYLHGKNLFETLTLNLRLDEEKAQHPIWEWSTEKKTNGYDSSHPQDLADIYTNCSRLIVIDPDTDLAQAAPDIRSVQLPKIDYADAGLETMTLWGKYRDDPNAYHPQAHDPQRSFWHSFGLLNNLPIWNGERGRLPGIMKWYRSKLFHKYVNKRQVGIVAIGMRTSQSDPSNSPHGEFYDELSLSDDVLRNADSEQTQAIFNETRTTERAVWRLERFGNDLTQIRDAMTFDPYASQKATRLGQLLVEQAYFHIDEPFKDWIAQVDADTDTKAWKDAWHRRLRSLLIAQAEDAIYPLQAKDMQGIPNEKDQGMENVATVYMRFQHALNRDFRKGED